MKAEFRILKNGYDRFQVDQKLQEYENTLETLETKVTMYETQMATYQQQLYETQKRVVALQEKLVMREKMFRDLDDQAVKRANGIVEAAKQEASVITGGAVAKSKLLLAQFAKVMDDTEEMDDSIRHSLEQLTQTIQSLQARVVEISETSVD